MVSSSTSPKDFLDTVWERVPEPMVCCQCNDLITFDDVLARTFVLQSLNDVRKLDSAFEITVPQFGDVIQFKYRHMSCLLGETTYVAISHVWHRQVAKLQHDFQNEHEFQNGSAEDWRQVEAVVREIPARIYRGVAKKRAGGFEIWHDYVSVPQWRKELETRILHMIPELFKRASSVVVYLADVDANTFHAMRNGVSQEARCHAISAICSAQWFSRVWTAMEFTQSSELLALDKDFVMVEPDPQRRSFHAELRDRWEVEVKKHGHGRRLENLVGRPTGSLVPFQLGPIDVVRDLTSEESCVPFAVAHQILVRRRLTRQEDFFHAIEGILKMGLIKELDRKKPREAIMVLATERLKRGDFSPLFMIPAWHQANDVPADQGYTDLNTFAIGLEEACPTFPKVDLVSDSGRINIQAEMVGATQFVVDIGSTRDALPTFIRLSRLVIATTGIDVDSFINSVAARFYCQDPDYVRRRLERNGQRYQFLDRLKKLPSADAAQSTDIGAWLALAMGLSDLSNAACTAYDANPSLTPMRFAEHHGDTLHLFSSIAICVACTSCHQLFPKRIFPLQPPSSLAGVKAYRIPGLKYRFSQPGGMGFLLAEGRMIARFIWGSYTCDCPKLTHVEVMLDDIQLPTATYR